MTERTGLDLRLGGARGRAHACGGMTRTPPCWWVRPLAAAGPAASSYTGDVIFMFQPGEEGHHGAEHMIAEGGAGARPAGGPAAAYALHVAVALAELPLGVVAARPGPMMAAADILDVTVRGRGGHASVPHLTLDPVPAGV